MTNPQQESEAIRFGFDDINDRTGRVTREIAICQINGWPISDDTKARLIAIESDAYALRVRQAALDGRAPPPRPEWLDPKPDDPGPEDPPPE